MKIAFCAIVKGSDDEAPLLHNLLSSVEEYVDGIFITITQPNDAVRATAEHHGAFISEFEWVGDFSAARNFNFAQPGDEYDYIMWGDADDTFDGMAHLRSGIEATPADAYLMWYAYDHDKYGLPTVVHAKTMVVRNDGSFIWRGRIHEDIDSTRELSVYLLEDVKRIHHPTPQRVAQSAERNLGIAMTEDESDPRTWWNRSNAFLSLSQYEKALEALERFVATSHSDAEKYLAYMRMGQIARHEGNLARAISLVKQSIAIHYDWPDAYFVLGEFLIEKKDLYAARDAIMEGLKRKPPVHQLIVFNPRDYDYNPLMLLARCYWEMGRPDEALTCLTSCKEIQPKNTSLNAMIDVAQEEADMLVIAKKARAKLEKYKSDKSARSFLDSLPDAVRQHPLISHWANQRFIKKTSEGNEVAYFCGITTEEWNPDSIKSGIGGSEEAVILLSREWAKKGYKVTVFANCGKEAVYDGVTWKPWYHYNPKDRYDITILWRSLRTLDYDINSPKIYVDLHDVVRPGEFTKQRVERLTKIFVKSQAHRNLYPTVPDEKFAIVNNPLDASLFEEPVERDPFLIVNTSSPERSLEAVCRIFRKIKLREPRAKLKWAYGWNVFEAVRSSEDEAMKWKRTITEYMNSVGVEAMGRISHADVANLYKTASVFLYPTRFYEIDCISARKAQIAGCNVVSSDFAALDETVKIGTKIHAEAPPATNIEMSDIEYNDEQYVQAVLAAFGREAEHLDPTPWKPENIADKWIQVWVS